MKINKNNNMTNIFNFFLPFSNKTYTQNVSWRNLFVHCTVWTLWRLIALRSHWQWEKSQQHLSQQYLYIYTNGPALPDDVKEEERRSFSYGKNEMGKRIDGRGWIGRKGMQRFQNSLTCRRCLWLAIT